jgi:3-dehydroquinate synthase
MEKVRVKLGYDICIGSGILSGLGNALKEYKLSNKVLLIANQTVDKHYGATVMRSLENAGFTVASEVIPDGEEHKTLEMASHLYDCAANARLDRQSPVIALGGGVTGDMVGFVAATYLRGLPFVQVPTTLLAQVDSSIGGKVAVNHQRGKNLIGAFHQPLLVWSDLETMKTLPYRELLTGLAENIKHGIIADADLFQFIEDNLPQILETEKGPMTQLVSKSCKVKTSVVEQDEQEKGLRAILNFGHTFGHAVENLTGYRRYRHGEAVALGMAAATRLASELKLLTESDRDEIIKLISRAGLPSMGTGLNPQELYKALAYDKKVVHGKLRFVLPVKIGKAEVFEGIAEKDILWAFETIC